MLSVMRNAVACSTQRPDAKLHQVGGVIPVVGIGRVRVRAVGLGEQVAGRARVVRVGRLTVPLSS